MKKKKNVMYRKSVSLLAAAAMTAVLMTGQVYPVLAEIGNVEANLETSSLIPDNVTIDQPIALSQVALPKSDYGTLSWADGTFVPDKRVQACDVVFKPAENVDLSYLPGWDAQNKVVKGTINVVVSSLEDPADDTQASPDAAETPSAGESQENGSSDTQAPAENPGESQNPEEAAPTEAPTETPAETPTPEPAAENPDATAASDNAAENGDSHKADQSENTDAAEKADNAADDLLKDAPVTEAPSAADAILSGETEADNALTAASGEETKEDTSAKITEAAEEDSVQDQTEEPAAEDPTASEVPAEDAAQNESAGGMLNDKFGDLMPGATVLDEVEPSENTDEAAEDTKEDTSSDEKNIFDNPADFTVSDSRPNTAEDDLTEEEQAARAAENHTCEGITVSGIDLPWYVQFQVESGESYEFKNEEKANIFQSYEFKLWDLKNNTEYEIPDGQYVSVTIPVKEGYEYSIEHLLANGATETIVPSVNGSTMVFSTHSFSPFGIAGFRPIIGDEIANGAYGENGTPTPTPTVTISGTPTPSPAVTGTAGTGTNGTNGTTGTDSTNSSDNNGGSASGTNGAADNSGSAGTSGSTGNTTGNTSDASSTSGNNGTSGNTAGSGTSSANGSSSTSGNSQSGSSTTGTNGQSQTSNAVKTGDETTILPFVLLLMTAAGVMAAVFGIRRKENE